jgi:lipopolysaccharide heptosyltransferase II
MKILIVRFSSIGDIVLTSPIVRCTRMAYPDAEIHFATKSSFASLLNDNPYINKLQLLDDSFMDFMQKMRAEKYDLVIDLHKNTRSFLIRLAVGAKAVSFDKLNYEKWLITQFKINKLPQKHLVDRYFDGVKSIGVFDDDKGLDFYISDSDKTSINAFLPTNENYIAWAIGAKYETKKFPIHKILDTLNQPFFENKKVVLLGGKEDMEVAQKIFTNLTNRTVINLVGELSLAQSAAVVNAAELLVTNDTGLMHIGAALKKPIVSIWGNTITDFGMYPFYGKSKVLNQALFVSDLSCRPCSKIGYSRCPKGHFDCMNKIDTTQVIKAIQSSLSQV